MNKQLEINAIVYQHDNKYYAKDDEGYKIELVDCTKNRDLALNEKQLLKGFIFSDKTPLFFCGIYRADEYESRLNLAKAAEEEQTKLEEKRLQDEAEAQRAATEQQQKIVEIERRRQEIYSDYNLKLVQLYKPMSKEEVENILQLTQTNCEHKPLDGKDLCEYQNIVEDRYKVRIVLIYSGTSFDRQDHFSVETI